MYFCDLLRARQLGSNENTIGLPRQFFPKGIGLSQSNPLEFEQVAHLLSGRPRKTLDWQTPAERMRKIFLVD